MVDPLPWQLPFAPVVLRDHPKPKPVKARKRKRPPAAWTEWYGVDVWGVTREDGAVDDGVVDTVAVEDPKWVYPLHRSEVDADRVRLARIGPMGYRGVWT